MMPVLGIDYIGGANYIDVIVNHHPTGYAAGFLVRAGGWPSGIKAVEALAATHRCPIIRVHGVWRDNHCFNEDDIKPAVKAAENLALVAAKYPDIKFYFSPWLEHRATNPVFQKCRKACREKLPKRIKIVSSGTRIAGCINEVHCSGEIAPPYIFSFDGGDMFKGTHQWRMIHDECILFFGWTPNCNGKKTIQDDTPRSERRAYLTPRGIERIVEALEEK